MIGDTPKENMFFSTIRIETLDGDEPGIGTGFVIEKRFGKDSFSLFLVTNKHVFHNATRALFYFNASDDAGKPKIGSNVNASFDQLQNWWVGHPNNDIDIAVLPIAPLLSRFQAQGLKVFFRYINESMIPTKDNLENFDAIEDIVFIGYPNGIYDPQNLLPVIRKGITATPVYIDFDGKPQFLIDASVFPGSSGSPVILFNDGIYTTRSGNISTGRRFSLLGIVSQVAYRTATGELVFNKIPITLQPIVQVQEMLDLGIVVKSYTIHEAIEEFFKQKPWLKPKSDSQNDASK